MVSLQDIRKLSLFKKVSDEALSVLTPHLLEKTFSAGEPILNEGDVTASVYFIVSGVVTVIKKSGRDKEKIKTLGQLERDDFFGEMAFIEKQPFSASVIAAESTHVYILPRTSLEKMIEQDRGKAFESILVLLWGLSSKLRRTTEELITVFEVSRTLCSPGPLEDMFSSIMDQLVWAFGNKVDVLIYRWNPFNEEYDLFCKVITSDMVYETTLSPTSSMLVVNPPQKNKMTATIQHQENKEGVLMVLSKETTFDLGKKQLFDSITSMLGPALSSLRVREEEVSRQRLLKSKNFGESL